jgi:8-oxo-dGTP diphosphatase
VLACRNQLTLGWQLPSGYLGTLENADEAAERVVRQFTGMKGVQVRQLHTFSEVDPTSSSLHVSISYLVLANCADFIVGRKPHGETRWLTFAQLVEFDSREVAMVTNARSLLRRETNVYPIISGLLEYRFTLTQLKSLYEAIFETQFDKRNFYKKMMSLKILVRQHEKEKVSSKKGAFYYVLVKKSKSQATSSLSALSSIVS